MGCVMFEVVSRWFGQFRFLRRRTSCAGDRRHHDSAAYVDGRSRSPRWGDVLDGAGSLPTCRCRPLVIWAQRAAGIVFSHVTTVAFRQSAASTIKRYRSPCRLLTTAAVAMAFEAQSHRSHGREWREASQSTLSDGNPAVEDTEVHHQLTSSRKLQHR